MSLEIGNKETECYIALGFAFDILLGNRLIICPVISILHMKLGLAHNLV